MAKTKTSAQKKAPAKPAPNKAASKASTGKAATAKTTTAKSSSTKTGTAKAAGKASAKETASVKPAAKASAKASTKPAVKATAKTAAKATSKASTKPAAKASAKTAVKPAAKASAKASTKPAAKASAKPVSKPTAKAAAKPAAKSSANPGTKQPPAKTSSAAKAPAFDKKFLDRQTKLLIAEREKYIQSSANLESEAQQLLETREQGDVQFDEESAQGDSWAIEREQDLILSAGARATVEKIDAALARIEKGTYGICEKTGKPIPRARLQAIPWATERVEQRATGLLLR